MYIQRYLTFLDLNYYINNYSLYNVNYSMITLGKYFVPHWHNVIMHTTE